MLQPPAPPSTTSVGGLVRTAATARTQQNHAYTPRSPPVFQSVVDKKSVELTQSVWGMTDGSLSRAFTGGFEKMAASVNRMVMTSGGVLNLGDFELQGCAPLQIHVICDVFRCDNSSSSTPLAPFICTHFPLPPSPSRTGMENKGVFNFASAIGNKAPLSPWFIFHVHGGGFVAQTRCAPPPPPLRLPLELTPHRHQQKSRVLPLDVVPSIRWRAR